MIAIYHPSGRTARVVESTLRIWLEKGWLTEQPKPERVSEDLRPVIPSVQASDVTAPGESEVEGITPATVKE